MSDLQCMQLFCEFPWQLVLYRLEKLCPLKNGMLCQNVIIFNESVTGPNMTPFGSRMGPISVINHPSVYILDYCGFSAQK